MRFERKVVGSTVHGLFEFDIVADNKTINRPRNGYSAWNGFIQDHGFEVEYTNSENVVYKEWAFTRKEAIAAAIHNYCEKRFPRITVKGARSIQPQANLRYELIK